MTPTKFRGVLWGHGPDPCLCHCRSQLSSSGGGRSRPGSYWEDVTWHEKSDADRGWEGCSESSEMFQTRHKGFTFGLFVIIKSGRWYMSQPQLNFGHHLISFCSQFVANELVAEGHYLSRIECTTNLGNCLQSLITVIWMVVKLNMCHH